MTAEAEIFFAHLDKTRSKQLFGDRNFVFTGEMKYLLGLTKPSPRRSARLDAASHLKATRRCTPSTLTPP